MSRLINHRKINRELLFDEFPLTKQTFKAVFINTGFQDIDLPCSRELIHIQCHIIEKYCLVLSILDFISYNYQRVCLNIGIQTYSSYISFPLFFLSISPLLVPLLHPLRSPVPLSSVPFFRVLFLLHIFLRLFPCSLQSMLIYFREECV